MHAHTCTHTHNPSVRPCIHLDEAARKDARRRSICWAIATTGQGLDTEMLARCVDIALASDVADSPKTDPRRGQQQHPPPQRRRAGGQQLFSLGINHMQGHYRSLLRVRACMALMAPGTQRGVCDGTDGLSGGWDPMHSGFGPAPEAMAHGMWQDSETWGRTRLYKERARSKILYGMYVHSLFLIHPSIHPSLHPSIHPCIHPCIHASILWPSGPGDGDLDRWVASAIARCNQRLHCTGLPGSLRPVIADDLRERAVTKQLDQAALAQGKADVTPDDVCRLHAGAATGERTLWQFILPPPLLTTTSPMRTSPLQ